MRPFLLDAPSSLPSCGISRLTCLISCFACIVRQSYQAIRRRWVCLSFRAVHNNNHTHTQSPYKPNGARFVGFFFNLVFLRVKCLFGCLRCRMWTNELIVFVYFIDEFSWQPFSLCNEIYRIYERDTTTKKSEWKLKKKKKQIQFAEENLDFCEFFCSGGKWIKNNFFFHNRCATAIYVRMEKVKKIYFRSSELWERKRRCKTFDRSIDTVEKCKTKSTLPRRIENLCNWTEQREIARIKMLCTSPPPPPASPAGSEISVGAPSPPPSHHRQSPIEQQSPLQLQNERRRGPSGVFGGDDYFRPLKRLRGITNSTRERSTSPPPPPPPPPTRSSIEGVKSFSIADILGHDATGGTNNNNSHTNSNNSSSNSPSTLHHQLNGKIVRPWDHLRGPVQAVRPFLPPALLHYEHRLAIDYHRHLEHLNAQAQLLRHMNMTMDMKSESGSERSSSAASDCCSPEIGSSGSRMSEHHMHHSRGEQQSSPAQHHHSGGGNGGNGQKTKPNGTPLDALFQMTNKSFDESQGDNDTGIFDVVDFDVSRACCMHCMPIVNLFFLFHQSKCNRTLFVPFEPIYI